MTESGTENAPHLDALLPRGGACGQGRYHHDFRQRAGIAERTRCLLECRGFQETKNLRRAREQAGAEGVGVPALHHDHRARHGGEVR